MGTMMEEDELTAVHEEREGEPDRELTLSSTTLLGIFFGLVLICGLCFGLGFTLGRHAPVEVPDQASVVQAAASSGGFQAKPSAGQTSAAVEAAPVPQPEEPQAADAAATTVPEQEEPAVKAAAEDGKAAGKPSEVAQEQPQERAQDRPQASAPVVPASGVSAAVMVQIAAVSNPADAEVLVSALQKHGYTATTRREPNDALIHVQIGPFASRAEANAMRQKLLADGYNAFLK